MSDTREPGKCPRTLRTTAHPANSVRRSRGAAPCRLPILPPRRAVPRRSCSLQSLPN